MKDIEDKRNLIEFTTRFVHEYYEYDPKWYNLLVNRDVAKEAVALLQEFVNQFNEEVY